MNEMSLAAQRALDFVRRDIMQCEVFRFRSLGDAKQAVAQVQSMVNCELGAAFRRGVLEARIYGSTVEWEPVLYLSAGARAAARLAGLRLPASEGAIAIEEGSRASLLSIPAARPEPREEVPDAAGADASGQELRVLIVEDHEDTARSLAELLEAWGCRAAIAPTGRDARTVAATFVPNIILLDLGLPDEHGYRVAQSLRATERLRDVPVVVVTGWSQQPADQAGSALAGVKHHLQKPVNPQALRTIIDRYRPAA